MEENTAPSFEHVMKSLESIVEKMESGGLSLDESIRLYEEGIQLKKKCQQFLDEATLKIEKLSLNGDLTPIEKP